MPIAAHQRQKEKRVSPQLSVSNVQVFNTDEYSIIQRLIAKIHESLDENEQFLPNMKLVTTCGIA